MPPAMALGALPINVMIHQASSSPVHSYQEKNALQVSPAQNATQIINNYYTIKSYMVAHEVIYSRWQIQICSDVTC